MEKLNWNRIDSLPSHNYKCGYCDNALASERGWTAHLNNSPSVMAHIYVCHFCSKPTFIDPEGRQTPGVVFGSSVADIPEQSVQDLFDEARKATGAGSYTAAVLCCRKLLMHIAVSKGAKPGESFAHYVEYLTDNHFVPPDAKDWVDHIRKKGNEANHDIVIMSTEDAQELIAFSEMLLKIIYEFPAAIKRKLTLP